jgi:hypothetical protein
MTDQPPAYLIWLVTGMELLTFLMFVAMLGAFIRVIMEALRPPEDDDGHPPDDFPEFPDLPTGPVEEEEREYELV